MGYISRRMRRLRKMRCLKDAPPEKDAPQGGKILAGALSVRQAQEALYQRSAVPSGCLYRGLGKNRPGHEILGPGAGAVHGTD